MARPTTSRRLWLTFSFAFSLVAIGLVRADDPKPVDVTQYKDPIKVACVGDSITAGAGAKTGPYPQRLAKLLDKKWEVRNFGVSGTTMLTNGDSPYVKQKSYQAALDFKPDVVVIKLGTNDSKPQNWAHKDDFATSAKSLIDAFRAVNPQIRVYVCYPVPAFPGNFGIRDEIIKDEVIPLLKQVAADKQTEVIDLYAALSGQGKFFPDKVHPNDEGYALIAATVKKALTGE